MAAACSFYFKIHQEVQQLVTAQWILTVGEIPLCWNLISNIWKKTVIKMFTNCVEKKYVRGDPPMWLIKFQPDAS